MAAASAKAVSPTAAAAKVANAKPLRWKKGLVAAAGDEAKAVMNGLLCVPLFFFLQRKK